jgi:diacylglycerol kinase family enzyme
VTIHCDKPTPINLDGELRIAQKVEMSLAEEKLRFFYPKGLTFAVKEPVEV